MRNSGKAGRVNMEQEESCQRSTFNIKVDKVLLTSTKIVFSSTGIVSSLLKLKGGEGEVV